MKSKYQDWIRKNYPTRLEAAGRCASATQAMVEAFPELRRCRGLVHFLGFDEREHWWCETADGEVIDPTVSQYGSTAVSFYEELPDDDPRCMYRRARCMECGEYYLETPELEGVMHTRKCEEAFARSMNDGY